MLTFYIVGVVIALFILLTLLSMAIDNDEGYGLHIIANMARVFVLSLSSWAVIYVIGMGFVFKLAKKRIKDK